jgi:hypothetical protein
MGEPAEGAAADDDAPNVAAAPGSGEGGMKFLLFIPDGDGGIFDCCCCWLVLHPTELGGGSGAVGAIIIAVTAVPAAQLPLGSTTMHLWRTGSVIWIGKTGFGGGPLGLPVAPRGRTGAT